MIALGLRYISIFKRSFFHPFITQKAAYKNLSKARQAYSKSVLKTLNIDVKLHGELPKEDKVLYAINHRSLLDILVMEHIFAEFDKNGTWIAKQELFDNAIYGKFFQYSGCISVDLESKKGLLTFFKSIKNILSRVDDMNIFIFPEGARNKQNGVAPFQSGASKIAKANNLQVVPVFINDSLEAVFRDAPHKKHYTVDVYVGAAINADTLEAEYMAFKESITGEHND